MKRDAIGIGRLLRRLLRRLLLLCRTVCVSGVEVVGQVLPGRWSDVQNTSVIPVSVTNLPNGDILYWSAYGNNDYRGFKGQTYIGTFTPKTRTISEGVMNHTGHDMFCPGASMLRNGVLMISGGSNAAETTFYDYRIDTWTIGPKLNYPRGYHAHVVLGDGRVLTVGGSWSGGRGNKIGEIWSPTNNTWSIMPNILSTPRETNDTQGVYRSDNHYWLFTAPNGRVFHAGPKNVMHWIDVTGIGNVTPSVNRDDDGDAMNGNAVMYDVGLILTVGGYPNYASGSGNQNAFTINLNGNEVTVARVGSMQFPRVMTNSVVLPSGEVVVVGGQAIAKLFTDSNKILPAELWSPETEQFTTLASMKIARTYHSVAILMKDGRVWAGGGGLCGQCAGNHADFEILTPPYLINDTDGSLIRTRPVIKSMSKSRAKAGDVFSVTMNTTGNHTFALVRLSAVTHSVSTDQRRVPLIVQRQASSTFTVQVHSNPNVALVGMYYLFAMNGLGVPSVARTLNISL